MFAIYLKEALMIVAVVSGIPLLVSSVVGLIVSLLQSVTQLQEQAVSFCVKFISVGAIGVLLGPWFCEKVVGFFQTVVVSIASFGVLP